MYFLMKTSNLGSRYLVSYVKTLYVQCSSMRWRSSPRLPGSGAALGGKVGRGLPGGTESAAVLMPLTLGGLVQAFEALSATGEAAKETMHQLLLAIQGERAVDVQHKRTAERLINCKNTPKTMPQWLREAAAAAVQSFQEVGGIAFKSNRNSVYQQCEAQGMLMGAREKARTQRRKVMEWCLGQLQETYKKQTDSYGEWLLSQKGAQAVIPARISDVVKAVNEVMGTDTLLRTINAIKRVQAALEDEDKGEAELSKVAQTHAGDLIENLHGQNKLAVSSPDYENITQFRSGFGGKQRHVHLAAASPITVDAAGAAEFPSGASTDRSHNRHPAAKVANSPRPWSTNSGSRSARHSPRVKSARVIIAPKGRAVRDGPYHLREFNVSINEAENKRFSGQSMSSRAAAEYLGKEIMNVVDTVSAKPVPGGAPGRSRFESYLMQQRQHKAEGEQQEAASTDDTAEGERQPPSSDIRAIKGPSIDCVPPSLREDAQVSHGGYAPSIAPAKVQPPMSPSPGSTVPAAHQPETPSSPALSRAPSRFGVKGGTFVCPLALVGLGVEHGTAADVRRRKFGSQRALSTRVITTSYDGEAILHRSYEPPLAQKPFL
ncbi:hypothetical protein CYMTET_56061 [Cymbomonas tetramitiformis]|uniref:Uncharacterized protein n=1 Tax=Cymbomonas tetramitiformis TaxID=36881 RepID=A0AAE0BCX8_9CHLO|nr:hypothetical protein CYMTET_56061 [Cymbomonas tetramitiformis]